MFDRKSYMKNYTKKNKDKLADYHRKYYILTKKHHKIIYQNWVKKHPWYSHYNNARSRCKTPKAKDCKYYKDKGIKFKMGSNDFMFLWFRDKAYLMKKPSIDRIDSNNNYVLGNCRFIEMSINNHRR